MKKVAVIGAGWYGCHIALEAAKAGHQVTIFEKNPDIFEGLSGKFGIRLHRGQHYPRSQKTRESCQRGFDAFRDQYRSLVVQHTHSIYGLGAKDVDGNPSKVDKSHFEAVCRETQSRDVDLENGDWDYTNLQTAFDVDEPSVAVGKKLRDAFTGFLSEHEGAITIKRNYSVRSIKKGEGATYVDGEAFDHVVNATSYQAFVPPKSELPVDMEVVYQPCLALTYEENNTQGPPFSFIVMDGSFPCLMPFDNLTKKERGSAGRQYIMTHGKYTIMGSFSTPQQAGALLASLDNDARFIDKIRPLCEDHMKHFWPVFGDRFTYKGWQGRVVAKIVSETEFRSAVTFEHGGMIHIIPGKVTNVCDAAREVLQLIRNDNVLQQGYCRYAKGGELHSALGEITQKPQTNNNTGRLQTFQDLMQIPAAGLGACTPATSTATMSTTAPIYQAGKSSPEAETPESLPAEAAVDGTLNSPENRTGNSDAGSDGGKPGGAAGFPAAGGEGEEDLAETSPRLGRQGRSHSHPQLTSLGK